MLFVKKLNSNNEKPKVYLYNYYNCHGRYMGAVRGWQRVWSWACMEVGARSSLLARYSHSSPPPDYRRYSFPAEPEPTRHFSTKYISIVKHTIDNLIFKKFFLNKIHCIVLYSFFSSPKEQINQKRLFFNKI